MRQSSCRCVAKVNDIAVAKVIHRRDGMRLVCIYHRDQQEDYNLKCRRGEDSKIINLNNNTICL